MDTTIAGEEQRARGNGQSGAEAEITAEAVRSVTVPTSTPMTEDGTTDMECIESAVSGGARSGLRILRRDGDGYGESADKR